MLLDTLGCMLAGRSAPEVAAFESHSCRLEQGSFRFPGGQGMSLLSAAAVGAMAATWDEACEGHALAHGRPGVPVIAALLPQAFARMTVLSELIAGVLAGYEIGARAGAWLRVRTGMHVDGNWPALGVAAGMAQLLRLPLEARMNAINTAACQLPASLYLPVKTGDNARNTYLAHSAWLGMLASLAAAAGVSAPEDALPHYAERFSAAGEDAPMPADRLFIVDAYLKPHAAVRHVHYGAEAALRVRKQLASDASAIRSIRLSIYQEAITYCGNREPQAPIQAQFSLSFGIAAALRYGRIDSELYRRPHFEDPELRRLEKLVQVEADPAIAAGARGATLAVDTLDRSCEVRVDAIKGDREDPMSRDEVTDKFIRYAAGSAVAPEKSRAFAEALLDADPGLEFSALWQLLF